MMFSRAIIFGALAASAVIGAGGPAAQAACYEVGCTDMDFFDERALLRLSCDALAMARNSMYAENAYCFKRLEYQRLWGNKDCRYTSSEAVPLSRIERANVAIIRRVEKTKDCPN